MTRSFRLLLGLFCTAVGSVLQAAPLGNWPEIPAGRPAKTYFTGAAYGSGSWVVVGEKGYIASSTDGVKWAKRSAGHKRDFNGVSHSGGRFIAVCKAADGFAAGAKIWVSDDGGNKWLPRDTDVGGDTIAQGLHAVASDGQGNLIAVGGGGGMTRSWDNGQTWHRVSPPVGTSWSSFYAVAYGKGVWIAGSTGGILRSTDAGATWTKVDAGKDLRSVCFGNNRWFGVDYWSDRLFWSVDGNTWVETVRAAGHGSGSYIQRPRGCTFADGLFVAVTSYGEIWTSETGRTVEPWQAKGDDPELVAVAPGPRGFFAVGGEAKLGYGYACQSPPWLRARIGGPWDHPFTAFDAEDGPPRKIALPEYRVNTASLNLHLEATLFHMPTLSAAMRLRLGYTSRPVTDDATDIGPFGKNWRGSHESLIGSFGSEVRLITGGGNSQVFLTPDGQDLSTVVGSLVLQSPDGSHDELTYTSGGAGFTLRTRATRMTYHYAEAGGPGDALWFLTAIEDRNGNRLTLQVAADETGGRVTRISDPAGRHLDFTYNDDGRCTRIDMPDGRHLEFSYDEKQNLVGIRDMAGYTAAYTYDKLGFLQRMTTAGRVNRFAWLPRPGYEDADSEQENAGDLILASVTTSNGGIVRYELLPKDAGVRRTDAAGIVTVFESEEGRTTGIRTGKGSRETVFNEDKFPVRFTDELGNVTEMEYDDDGRPVKVIDALDRETEFEYDARGNLLTRRDPLDQVWHFTYDANDNLASTRTPLNHTTSYDYHPNGRLWKTTDPRAGVVENQYNAQGDLVSQTDATGHIASFDYDLTGRCTQMTDREGRIKSLSYDANDRITRVGYDSAPGSPERLFAYDAFGQVRFTDELGEVTEIARNDFGYITRLSDPLGQLTQTEYNPDNLPVRVIDPMGRVTQTAYDAKGRPVRVTDPMGGIVAREYDEQGNLVRLTDPRKSASRFVYDANNRLVEMADPLGQTVRHERDALGRVTVTTNARGQQIRVTYDADGRITRKEHREAAPGAGFAEVASSVFDGTNNLTSRSDAWGTTSWEYDASNRATRITYPTGHSLQFSYTATGQIRTVTYPNGLVVTLDYDDFHRQKVPNLLRSGSEAVGMKEPGSNVVQVDLDLGADSQRMVFAHDGAGRLTGVQRSAVSDLGTAALTSEYDYDAVGRPTGIRHLTPAGTAFAWDLQYDAVGNVVAETRSGFYNEPPLLPAATKLVYDVAGRIRSRDGRAYSHDADGNLTGIAGGEFEATYSPENKPLTMRRRIGEATEDATHTYDGSGVRVRRDVGDDAIQYHYGPAGRLMFTTDADGDLLTCYIWGDRSLLASVQGGSLTALRHYLTGQLMSVAGATDAAGDMLATYSYDPFGQCARQVRKEGHVDDNPFTFVGGLGVIDEGDGLFYMHQRFYDATTGRFLQKDPAGFEGGLNLYAYAAGNPLNAVDPAGTWDINWARFTKGVKQIAVAGVGIGLLAISAPVTGTVGTVLVGVAAVNTVFSGAAGVCNIALAAGGPKDDRAGKQLDQVDGFGKILGVGAGALYTGFKGLLNGGKMDPKELQENMKTGSGVGSTLDMAANGARWQTPAGHVINTLNNIATADAVGQAYGESAAILTQEVQAGEQPSEQANAPAGDGAGAPESDD
jgi:RHS repeat-associated protein